MYPDFSQIFSFFCFLSSCFFLCVCFFNLKIYLLLHIWYYGRVNDNKEIHPAEALKWIFHASNILSKLSREEEKLPEVSKWKLVKCLKCLDISGRLYYWDYLRYQTCTETALQRCSDKKVLCRYADYFQENIHAELWFQ